MRDRGRLIIFLYQYFRTLLNVEKFNKIIHIISIKLDNPCDINTHRKLLKNVAVTVELFNKEEKLICVIYLYTKCEMENIEIN